MTDSLIHWCLFIQVTDVEKSQKWQLSLEKNVKGLTGAGKPLSIRAELDRRDGFSVAS